MGNGRVVFTLKREKHIQPTVPGNIPTQTRGCLRKYDHLMLERKFTEAADLVHEHGTLLGYQAMDNIRGLEFHQKALAASKKAHDKNRQARWGVELEILFVRHFPNCCCFCVFDSF